MSPALIWLIVGLLSAEIAMHALGWRGLTLSDRAWLAPLGLAAAAALLISIAPLRWQEPLIGVPLGLALFLGLAVWRRRRFGETLFARGERDGRRISAAAIPIADGPLPAILVEPLAGSAHAVLLLHGAGDHKTHFTWPLLHGLADAGLAACAIDVDGHGENPRWLDLPDVLDDVRAGVAWLRERYSWVAVVGVSQGGCVAARAVAEGVAVDALALLEAPVSIAVTRAVIRSEARILAHRAAWALHRDLGTLPLARTWSTAPTRTRIGTVELIARLDLLGSVRRIDCPLLLCYGGSDAVVPPAQAHAVAAAAPPGTTFALTPRATHLSLSIDRRVVRTLSRWLKAVIADQPAVARDVSAPR
jgi:alpha-beta hydrolase superfamily lysophospholipase